MTEIEITKALSNHGIWLTSNGLRGRCADLYEADLRWTNLVWANLTGADLTEADLTGANLYEAHITGTPN